ncbi:unnamed protein product [Caenorhabditis auriculariae]|uniref:Uncharacterized protein n=1 Tax=Caenorhabditis auriculariae TaxID=2777116 RepID=A0A8S1H2U0_9PELO|nr:unnamed protein product [Caenorhabditis auriculariae]
MNPSDWPRGLFCQACHEEKMPRIAYLTDDYLHHCLEHFEKLHPDKMDIYSFKCSMCKTLFANFDGHDSLVCPKDIRKKNNGKHRLIMNKFDPGNRLEYRRFCDRNRVECEVGNCKQNKMSALDPLRAILKTESSPDLPPPPPFPNLKESVNYPGSSTSSSRSVSTSSGFPETSRNAQPTAEKTLAQLISSATFNLDDSPVEEKVIVEKPPEKETPEEISIAFYNVVGDSEVFEDPPEEIPRKITRSQKRKMSLEVSEHVQKKTLPKRRTPAQKKKTSKEIVANSEANRAETTSNMQDSDVRSAEILLGLAPKKGGRPKKTPKGAPGGDVEGSEAQKTLTVGDPDTKILLEDAQKKGNQSKKTPKGAPDSEAIPAEKTSTVENSGVEKTKTSLAIAPKKGAPPKKTPTAAPDGTNSEATQAEKKVLDLPPQKKIAEVTKSTSEKVLEDPTRIEKTSQNNAVVEEIQKDVSEKRLKEEKVVLEDSVAAQIVKTSQIIVVAGEVIMGTKKTLEEAPRPEKTSKNNAVVEGSKKDAISEVTRQSGGTKKTSIENPENSQATPLEKTSQNNAAVKEVMKPLDRTRKTSEIVLDDSETEVVEEVVKQSGRTKKATKKLPSEATRLEKTSQNNVVVEEVMKEVDRTKKMLDDPSIPKQNIPYEETPKRTLRTEKKKPHFSSSSSSDGSFDDALVLSEVARKKNLPEDPLEKSHLPAEDVEKTPKKASTKKRSDDDPEVFAIGTRLPKSSGVSYRKVVQRRPPPQFSKKPKLPKMAIKLHLRLLEEIRSFRVSNQKASHHWQLEKDGMAFEHSINEDLVRLPSQMDEEERIAHEIAMKEQLRQKEANDLAIQRRIQDEERRIVREKLEKEWMEEKLAKKEAQKQKVIKRSPGSNRVRFGIENDLEIVKVLPPPPPRSPPPPPPPPRTKSRKISPIPPPPPPRESPVEQPNVTMVNNNNQISNYNYALPPPPNWPFPPPPFYPPEQQHYYQNYMAQNQVAAYGPNYSDYYMQNGQVAPYNHSFAAHQAQQYHYQHGYRAGYAAPPGGFFNNHPDFSRPPPPPPPPPPHNQYIPNHAWKDRFSPPNREPFVPPPKVPNQVVQFKPPNVQKNPDPIVEFPEPRRSRLDSSETTRKRKLSGGNDVEKTPPATMEVPAAVEKEKTKIFVITEPPKRNFNSGMTRGFGRGRGRISPFSSSREISAIGYGRGRGRSPSSSPQRKTPEYDRGRGRSPSRSPPRKERKRARSYSRDSDSD